MNRFPSIPTSKSATESADWPDDETLLLYLVEPSQLTASQSQALLNWLAAAPEHADRLAQLAQDFCEVAEQVQSLSPLDLPTPTVELHRPMRRRARWVSVATAAATVLLAAWWFSHSLRNSNRVTDEVALVWAINHGSWTPSEIGLWAADDWELLFDPSLAEVAAVQGDLAIEETEHAFGFSESEPPEWLLAAFDESLNDPRLEIGANE